MIARERIAADHRQIPPDFADHTIGDAILDRVIHRAHRLELKGPSMRKRHNAEVSATSTGLTNAKEKWRRNQPSVASPRCSGMPHVSAHQLTAGACS